MQEQLRSELQSEIDRLRERIEQDQSADYRKMQEIVRQEYEYKFIQQEKQSKQKLDKIFESTKKEKDHFLESKSQELASNFQTEIAKLNETKEEEQLKVS